jgi:hypothetical protein
MRVRLSVLVPIVAVLAVTGCGSSSKAGSSASSTNAESTSAGTTATASTTPVSTTGGSGPPLSRSELVARADAICKPLNTELVSSKYKVKTLQDIARIAPQRAAAEQTALSVLSKLTPPSSMAQDYQKMLVARQTVIEDIRKLGEDAAANNMKAATPLYTSSATVIRHMGATATRNGFKYCGELG